MKVNDILFESDSKRVPYNIWGLPNDARVAIDELNLTKNDLDKIVFALGGNEKEVKFVVQSDDMSHVSYKKAEEHFLKNGFAVSMNGGYSPHDASEYNELDASSKSKTVSILVAKDKNSALVNYRSNDHSAAGFFFTPKNKPKQKKAKVSNEDAIAKGLTEFNKKIYDEFTSGDFSRPVLKVKFVPGEYVRYKFEQIPLKDFLDAKPSKQTPGYKGLTHEGSFIVEVTVEDNFKFVFPFATSCRRDKAHFSIQICDQIKIVKNGKEINPRDSAIQGVKFSFDSENTLDKVVDYSIKIWNKLK